ncbi:unnamed protein product, partial [Thlaspi arvense]
EGVKMKKYGLQLRVQPSQKKQQPSRPPLPTALGFRDDDEDDVEREISRQASKNKALKDIEEQHKKALEEDPSVFEYDGVYDEMKEKVARPLAHDRQERKPKYIQALIEKTKQREREHEIIYERKWLKRGAKRTIYLLTRTSLLLKLAEQAKWLEEERLHQLREEKEDVTKKSDLTDFYFNLSKNVAFGAGDAKASKPEKRQEEVTVGMSEERLPSANSHLGSTEAKEEQRGETSTSSRRKEGTESGDSRPLPDAEAAKQAVAEKPSSDEARRDHHKRGEDALAAAKERFLARKRAKEQ